MRQRAAVSSLASSHCLCRTASEAQDTKRCHQNYKYPRQKKKKYMAWFQFHTTGFELNNKRLAGSSKALHALEYQELTLEATLNVMPKWWVAESGFIACKDSRYWILHIVTSTSWKEWSNNSFVCMYSASFLSNTFIVLILHSGFAALFPNIYLINYLGKIDLNIINKVCNIEIIISSSSSGGSSMFIYNSITIFLMYKSLHLWKGATIPSMTVI